MSTVANVTLRTRAIVYPSEIPSSLSLLAFACSDRDFGNLLCKSAALPPQKLPLLAEGEFMLRYAKLRRGLSPLLRMTHEPVGDGALDGPPKFGGICCAQGDAREKAHTSPPRHSERSVELLQRDSVIKKKPTRSRTLTLRGSKGRVPSVSEAGSGNNF